MNEFYIKNMMSMHDVINVMSMIKKHSQNKNNVELDMLHIVADEIN